MRRASRTAWRDGAVRPGERIIPEETAVALTYNHMTHAVMMATPSDLDDFAVGFRLTEGIIAYPSEIETLEVVPSELGVELRMRIAAPRATRLPTGVVISLALPAADFAGSKAWSKRCGRLR